MLWKSVEDGEERAELGRSHCVDSDPRTGASGPVAFQSDEADPSAEDGAGTRTAQEPAVHDAVVGRSAHSEPLAPLSGHQARAPNASSRNDLPRHGTILLHLRIKKKIILLILIIKKISFLMF